MTLKEYIYNISNDPKEDKIALASVRLGVGYHALYSWLKGTRKPGKFVKKHLESKGIVFDKKIIKSQGA